MASITLETLWLNDADDPADLASFPFMSSLNSSPQQNVTITAFAGGRQIAIVTPGSANQVSVNLAACTASQRAWLETHAGTVVCVRDDRGRKFYGVYVSPSSDEHAYNDDADSSLTLNEVTFSEAV